MKFDLRDIPITPLFESSIEAFGSELRHLMDPNKETPTFLLKQQDDLKMVKDQQENIKPPFFTFRLADVGYRDEGMPASKGFKAGVQFGGPKSHVDDKGKPVDPNLAWDSLHYIAVDVNINVEYYCSYNEQIRFSQEWLFLALKRVPLVLKYKTLEIVIYVVYDKTITYSDIDFDKDSLVSCETTAVLQTYMAKSDIRKPVSRYTVNERILGATDETDLSIKDGQRKRLHQDAAFTFDDDGRKDDT